MFEEILEAILWEYLGYEIALRKMEEMWRASLKSVCRNNGNESHVTRIQTCQIGSQVESV